MKVMPDNQFKNVTLAHSSYNLKMLPVAAGAVGMWKSGGLTLAGFPSAEGSGRNSLLSLELSTLSSARHFHRAFPALFCPTRTRMPTILRTPGSWSGNGLPCGDDADRRAEFGALHHRGCLAAESEDPPPLGLHHGGELKRIETLTQTLQLRYPRRSGRPASRQPLQRGLRCLVMPPRA
jgi:hypothetical protein